jgi:uncharacterized protein YfaS (alpha-2-macroglobulin family)
VQVTVSNSRGAELKRVILPGSEEGGIDLSVETEKGAPTGHYSVRIRLVEVQGRALDSIKDFPSRQISETFQVEEFRPATFSAGIEGLKDVVHGATLKLEATGSYLFGAPMSGARSTLAISASSTDIFDSRFQGFFFGDASYDAYAAHSLGLVSRVDGRLDGSGKLGHSFRTDLARKSLVKIKTENAGTIALIPHLSLSVENRVIDAGDRSVTANKTATVFADEVYPGIKRKRYFVSAGKPAGFQLIAMDLNRRVQSADLTVEVFRRVYQTTDSQGPGGSSSRETTETIERVSRQSISTKKTPVDYSFTPTEAGEYFILVRTSEGAFARVPFYVSGGGYGYWGLSQDDRVELIPEQTDYKPGDTARVLIQSPFEKATAIITVEREKVFTQKVIQLKSSAQSFEIPIKPEYLPEVHVA